MKTENRKSKIDIRNLPGDGRFDAVVVGAGPAGSVGAALLAERGWRVLLVEKSTWPRAKACGGCLNAAGVRMLRQAGLGEALEGAGEMARMELRSGSSLAEIDLPHGAVVERQTFDARLVELAVARGATFLPEARARLLPAGDSGGRNIRLQLAGGEVEVRARVVLACDGLGKTGSGFLAEEPWALVRTASRGRLGFAATVPGDQLPAIPVGTLRMCLGTEGYVGLVQLNGEDNSAAPVEKMERLHQAGTHMSPAIENGGLRRESPRTGEMPKLVHLGAALSPEACNARRGALPVIEGILRSCGVPLRTQGTPEIIGTGPLTCRRDVVGSGRVLALGDAAGYVEPFTGEGISWAIRAAVAVAELLPGRAEKIPDDVGARWQRYFTANLRPRQKWCRSLRAIIGRPRLARAGVQLAHFMPRGAGMLARHISE